MRRPQDVFRATLVASVVSGAPSTVHAVLTGRGVLDAARAAGSLLPGRDDDRPGLIAGGIVHAVVSGFWGAVLGLVLPKRHTASWGALAGVGIAAVSLPTIGRRHPPIAALPPVPQWLDNVAFGLVVGSLLSSSDAAAP